MTRRAARGAPIVFGICLQHQGTCYPSDDWSDFGAVILGWWLVAAAHLLENRGSTELHFMDGPYAVEVRSTEDGDELELLPAAQIGSWRVPVGDFIEELIRAAETVRTELLRLGIAAEDQASLAYGIAMVRNAPVLTTSRR
jgi:hypothetical protein